MWRERGEMLNRLWCWIGWHRWVYLGWADGGIAERRCRFCGIRELTVVDWSFPGGMVQWPGLREG